MAKETTIMQEKICYCFNYTAADLKKDVMQHGRSTIMERIIAESKQGNCDCKNNNPKGRWCLVDVRQVVNTAMAEAGKAGLNTV